MAKRFWYWQSRIYYYSLIYLVHQSWLFCQNWESNSRQSVASCLLWELLRDEQSLHLEELLLFMHLYYYYQGSAFISLVIPYLSSANYDSRLTSPNKCKVCNFGPCPQLSWCACYFSLRADEIVRPSLHRSPLGPIEIQVDGMHDIHICDTLESQRAALSAILARLSLLIFGPSVFSKVLNLCEMFSKEKGARQTTVKILRRCHVGSSLLSLLVQTLRSCC